MKIELPNYSNYLWRYGDVADSLSDSVQEHDDPVWNLIHSKLKTPSTSEINRRAVKQFVELATKAIHLSKHFTADLTIEIDERLRGIISFECLTYMLTEKRHKTAKRNSEHLLEMQISCISAHQTISFV